MQYTPLQLKDKLLESIDNENNVVDLPRVLEVVLLLEKYPITKDILEETRIGRIINDVRRKTSDKQLAKKAKELVRNWQKVVSGTSESNTTVNGDGLNSVGSQGRSQGVVNKKPPVAGPLGKSASTTAVNKTKNSVISSLSPGHPQSKLNTPAYNINNNSALQQSAKRSNSSPQLFNASSAKRFCASASPKVFSQPGTPDSVSSQNSRTSSSAVINDRPHTPSSVSRLANASDSRQLQRTHSSGSLTSNAKTKVSDIRSVQSATCLSPSVKVEPNSGQNGVVKTHFNGGDTPTHSIETKGLKTTIRFNKTSPPAPPINGVVETPKKRQRGRPPKIKPQTQESPEDQPRISPPNGSASYSKKLSERRKMNLGLRTEFDTPTSSSRADKFVSLTPKVKNTAELIQSLQAKNSLSIGKDTARQIQSNMFHKEMDDEMHSVVPDGAKPRPHHKKGKHDLVPPSTPVSLKTKTELVQKFLATSVDQSTPDDLSPLKNDMPRTESPGNASSSFDDSIEGNSEYNNSKRNLSGVNKYTTGDQKNSMSVISNLKTEKGPGEPKPGTSSETEPPLTLEEIYSKYPPLDLDSFVFDEDMYEIPEPLDVTTQDVNNLHNGHWIGVNGQFDDWGTWKDWTQTVSLQSYNSDVLHILPYVNVDD